MNEYAKLTLGGKEYSLCFKVGAIRILKKQFGYDIYEVFKQLDGIGALSAYMPEIVYSAAACYCSIEKKPVNFTIEDITSELDALDQSDYVKVINLVIEAYVTPLKEQAPAEVEENSDPFPVGGRGAAVSGSDVHAPVGAGLVHVQRAAV